MSLIKTFTNIAKGGVNSLASTISYVDSQIDKKRNQEFQDKLSAKQRKEFSGQIMTDNEVEEMNRNMQKYIEIDKKAKEFAEENGLNIDNKPKITKKTGYKKTNKITKQHNKKKEILKKMKQTRDLRKLQDLQKKARLLASSNSNPNFFIENYFNSTLKKIPNSNHLTQQLYNLGLTVGSCKINFNGDECIYYGFLKNGKPHGPGAVENPKAGKYYINLLGFYEGEYLTNADNPTEAGLAQLVDLAKRPKKPYRRNKALDVISKLPKFTYKVGKQLLFDYCSAHKKNNTALIYFSHKDFNRTNSLGIKYDPLMSCEEVLNKQYDKKYNGFACIDIKNFNSPQIHTEIKKVVDYAIANGLETIKMIIDSHGDEYGNLYFEFSMDEMKWILNYLEGKFDGKNLYIDLEACYTALFNSEFDFDLMKELKQFSIKNPNSNIILKTHNSNHTTHITLPCKAYGVNQLTRKFQLLKQGEIISCKDQNFLSKILNKITNDQKNNNNTCNNTCDKDTIYEILGEDYTHKKQFKPLKNAIWKISSSTLLFLIWLSIKKRDKIKACCNNMAQKTKQCCRNLSTKCSCKKRKNNTVTNTVNINNNINNDIAVNINRTINNHIGGDLINHEVLPSSDALNK